MVNQKHTMAMLFTEVQLAQLNRLPTSLVAADGSLDEPTRHQPVVLMPAIDFFEFKH